MNGWKEGRKEVYEGRKEVWKEEHKGGRKGEWMEGWKQVRHKGTL